MPRSRRRTRPGGVRRRLTVAFVLVAAVSAGALATGSYLLVRQSRLAESLSRARIEADVDLGLASGLKPSLSPHYLASFARQYEERRVHVVLAFPGQAGVASDSAVDPPIPPALHRLVAAGQLGYQRMPVDGIPYLVLGGKVPDSTAQMYFLFSEGQIRDDLAQLRDVLLAGWAVIVLLALAVGRMLATRTLEPVARASAAARSMAGGELETRLPAAASDEFGTWAASFNLMADALESKINALSAAQARERRFTSDVAHELRTPLTALVAEASLLRQSLGKMPAEARRPAELLIADVTRLRTLVEELMEISRLDAGQEIVAATQVEVDSLIDGLIRAGGWRDVVALDGAGQGIVLWTDPRRLERVVANLVDNAVRHGQTGTRVVIGQQGGYAVLEVADSGPGIAAEHLPHIFDRFYKADPARAGGGSGLGLAIAQENARLIGGDLTVHSGPSGGARFVLRLPLAVPASVREL